MKGLLTVLISLVLLALTGRSPAEVTTPQKYEQIADADDVKKKKKKGKKLAEKGKKKKKGFFSKVFGSK
jgi:hypothetical protein|tara:strand:- start:1624 stop:1830 length:207 start_codon:yes stop_codon:yes gene_type:complete